MATASSILDTPLYPGKAGGVSNYGAFAWIRYTKLIAPLSVWCYWFAWSPIIAIGVGLASGYILTALFPADSIINTWQLTLLDLSFIKAGLVMRINATWLLGALILLATFMMQHGGIQRSARVTYGLALVSLVPLLLIGKALMSCGLLCVAAYTLIVVY
jgi:amino acid transporter